MDGSKITRSHTHGLVVQLITGAITILMLVALTGCPVDGPGGSGGNDVFCSMSEQDRCYDAGCTDGDNSESPNPSAASCGGECREYYCDGYCECEIWVWNEECSECM